MGSVIAAPVPPFEIGRSLRPSRVSDELLARYAARGSDRAFAALYERYHQPVYRYCRSIVRNDADAQDALQAAFVGALSALRRNQRSAPLRPWLFRIAHNEAISILRHRRRERECQSSIGPEAAASAEERVAERARCETLMRDIGGLPERQRSALLLRELSGLSHEEIATALEITAGAAKQAIFEARQALSALEEGRAMSCEDVRRRLSDGDRRVLRGRRVAAHLRACSGCAAFATGMSARGSELRAVVPVLPPAVAAALLTRALRAASVHGAGGAAATGAAAAGGAASTGGAAVSTGGAAVSTGATAAGTAIATKAATAAVLVATAAAGATGLSHVLQGHHAASVRPASHVRHHGSAAAGADGRSTFGVTRGGVQARGASSRAAARATGTTASSGRLIGNGAKPSAAGAGHGVAGSSHGTPSSTGPGASIPSAEGGQHQPPGSSGAAAGAPAGSAGGAGHGGSASASSGSHGSSAGQGPGSSGAPQAAGSGRPTGAKQPSTIGGVTGSIHTNS